MGIFREYVKTSANAIDRSARMFGSEKSLAEKIGVSRELLNYWKFNTLLPYDKAIAIFLATNGQVCIDELRPDLKNLTKKFMLLFFKNRFVDGKIVVS